MLLTDAAVVAVSQSKAHPLHPHDMLLVANFVRASEGFRQAQSFTPVCLPRFNKGAFLHALVTYLHQVRPGTLCNIPLSAWLHCVGRPSHAQHVSASDNVWYAMLHHCFFWERCGALPSRVGDVSTPVKTWRVAVQQGACRAPMWGPSYKC